MADESFSILILGNEKWKWNAEHDWADGFQRLGYRARVLDERTPSQKILRAARGNDLVLWISSGKFIDRQLMKKLSGICKTVSWHSDLFWGLNRKGWAGNPMWDADFCFTADGENQEKWKKKGINHQWLLPGVRNQWTETNGKFDPFYACDVAFVGNNGDSYHSEWPYRKELVSSLVEICRKNGWSFKNPGGRDPLIERDFSMNDFYASAKVTVGDSLCFSKEKAAYWSDRVYEATGRGGTLVMPYISLLENQFPDMKFYEWSNWENLEQVIGGLLENKAEKTKTAEKCRLVTRSFHTYENRAQTLLDFIKM